MLIIRSDVPEYKCVKRDHHIGIRHLCKITYCRILFTTEKKLTEIWGSSSLLPRFCNLSQLCKTLITKQKVIKQNLLLFMTKA